MSPDRRPRLIFANQLRGIAALCVVISHMLGVFWAMRDFVGLATASPPQDGPLPPAFSLVSFTWFNFGPFGVSLFFLISGLVIPISLGQHTRTTFLIARILRIFPTLLVALALEMAVLHADAWYWGRPFPYSNIAIASNALLFYNLIGQPSVDLVNWTLCIEVKFYLIMAVLYLPMVRRGVWPLWLAGGLLLLVSALSSQAGPGMRLSHYGDALTAVSTEAPYIIFMLCGVLFNLNHSGQLPGLRFPASLAVMVVLFLGAWRISPLAGQFFVVTANYLYGLGSFSVLYGLRRFAPPIRALDFLAKISYPLYLVHSIIGFSVLKIVMVRWHMPYLPALGCALLTVILIAFLLHFTVERWSISLGRDIGRRSLSAVVGRPARP